MAAEVIATKQRGDQTLLLIECEGVLHHAVVRPARPAEPDIPGFRVHLVRRAIYPTIGHAEAIAISAIEKLPYRAPLEF
jgi:hypothetical protein